MGLGSLWGRRPGCHLVARSLGRKLAQLPAQTHHLLPMASKQLWLAAQTRRQMPPASPRRSAGLQLLCNTEATPTTTTDAEGRWQNPWPASETGPAERTPAGCHCRPGPPTGKATARATAGHPRKLPRRVGRPGPRQARRRSAPATVASDGRISGSTPTRRPPPRATSWETPARNSGNWGANQMTRAGPQMAPETRRLAAAAASHRWGARRTEIPSGQGTTPACQLWDTALEWSPHIQLAASDSGAKCPWWAGHFPQSPMAAYPVPEGCSRG
mmetsp:Transcript_42433/g.92551  ORF Transcript_42433/g.92551 Transcript_42433/m.92551 type:complete len:272 (+) Transcript_42433:2536-3351(+)